MLLSSSVYKQKFDVMRDLLYRSKKLRTKAP